jgi:PTH1 family peptidyl-tRNA hydrolase
MRRWRFYLEEALGRLRAAMPAASRDAAGRSAGVMQADRLHLVAGLGNPGQRYTDTRHNAGFLAVDRLASESDVRLDKKKFDTVFGRGAVGGRAAILAKPQAFMNRSGPPLRRLADYFGISGEDMVVIHDDVDLAFGRIKIKQKGGDGGHKGMKSLIDAFGGGDFVRIRIGVGRGGGGTGCGGDVVDHVLGRFDSRETEALDRIIATAAEAAAAVLCHGVREAMNRFNSKRTLI